MRGVPLRCPYHLYKKKNKSVSCFFPCLQTYYTRRLNEELDEETRSLKELLEAKFDELFGPIEDNDID